MQTAPRFRGRYESGDARRQAGFIDYGSGLARDKEQRDKGQHRRKVEDPLQHTKPNTGRAAGWAGPGISAQALSGIEPGIGWPAPDDAPAETPTLQSRPLHDRVRRCGCSFHGWFCRFLVGESAFLLGGRVASPQARSANRNAGMTVLMHKGI